MIEKSLVGQEGKGFSQGWCGDPGCYMVCSKELEDHNGCINGCHVLRKSVRKVSPVCHQQRWHLDCSMKSLGLGVMIGFALVVVFIPGPTVFHGLNVGFNFGVFIVVNFY